MSLKTRLGLLAGSSLAVAGLSAAVSLGAALVPTTAAAQTCTPTAVTVTGSDGAADTVTCTAGVYPTGITYSSAGDLSVSMIANGATVNSTMTANGVNLTGNGSNSVTWNSTVGALTGGAGTAGPVIDVTSVSGAISITTRSVDGTSAGTTHGIRAVSTGGGAIIVSTGNVSNNVAGGQAAISAVTNGGNIDIASGVGGGNVQGRLRGIFAQTSGAGTVNVTVATSTSASDVNGAAIDTIAGTGATAITLTGGTVTGGLGRAIRSASTSTLAQAVTIQVASVAVLDGSVDFSGVTAGGVLLNAGNGTWRAKGASVFGGGDDTILVSVGNLAAGASISTGGGADTLTLRNFNIFGALDLGSGNDVLNLTGTIALNVPGTAINFGADADTFNLSGVVTTTNASLDFGSGADTFNYEGALFAEGTTLFSNLEAFNNTATLYLGGKRDGFGLGDITDGTTNDRLVMSSGVFTGAEGSRIALDANLGTSGSQVGCAATTFADCVDFTGASTAGSTLLKVTDTSFDVNGGTLGAAITLIEGSTAAEHFSLDPSSTFYLETPDGGVIRKALVAYRLAYDEANHRHFLFAAPTDEPFQVGTFAASAQETWRATTGSWLTRQADLRATPGGLANSNGVWARIGAQAGERETSAVYEVQGQTFDYDLSQKQKIAHMVFGADMLGFADGDTALVLGGMVGFVRSDVEFEATSTEAVTSGFTGGVYASYLAGPLFIDATANANILHIKANAPAMGLGLDVPMRFDLKSLGGQVEAGWRFGMDSGLFVEPLVGVSYVVTRIEETEVPGGSGVFDFEEGKSLRLGGGARIGLDSEMAGMAASYSLTGRYWNDSEGQNSATITTASGSSALLPDDFGGAFSEVMASLNLYSDGGGVSGFLNLGGKWADDYQAVDGSIGVRVRW